MCAKGGGGVLPYVTQGLWQGAAMQQWNTLQTASPAIDGAQHSHTPLASRYRKIRSRDMIVHPQPPNVPVPSEDDTVSELGLELLAQWKREEQSLLERLVGEQPVTVPSEQHPTAPTAPHRTPLASRYRALRRL